MSAEDHDTSGVEEEIVEVEEEYIEIGVHEMQNGIKFESEAIAVKGLEKWCGKSFCSLTKTRYRRAMNIENGLESLTSYLSYNQTEVHQQDLQITTSIDNFIFIQLLLHVVLIPI